MAQSSTSTESHSSGPNQPKKFSFPTRSFGKQGETRSFKPGWFDSWPWLDYREVSDSVLCFYCSHANCSNLLNKALYSKRDESFVSKGFVNWKDACASFRKHELTGYHVDAVRVVTKPQPDVGEMLSKQHSKEKKLNGRMLLVIIQTLQFIGRQGIACRGHQDEESNFIQILKLRGHDQPEVRKWLNKRNEKYTSPEIQNELLSLMSCSILRSITTKLQQADFFTIMVGECVDISNNEQLAVCFRYVDPTLAVHEEFMGLYQCPDITANTLVTILQDILLRFNLDISRCRGQCYDGGSNMAGCRNGVKTQILRKEPRALFTHCYGHSLSLSVGDAIKLIPLLRNTMDTVHEISKMLQYSPKRSSLFKHIKCDISPDTMGFRVLCPTRWTVRGETLKSILDNYTPFLQLWERMLDERIDSDARARVGGFHSQMNTFDFFFGITILHTLLRHTDNLSKTLQNAQMSAAEGQQLAKMTIATLQSLREEEAFDMFWERAITESSELDIGEPSLPRKRKPPQHSIVGTSETPLPLTAKSHYKAIYYESLDTVMCCIKHRFEQEGYQMYSKLENLLLNSKPDASQIEEAAIFYGTDFDKDKLIAQLQTFHSNYHIKKDMCIKDFITFVKEMTGGQKQLLSEVVTVVRLLLVMPATNAASERSFSSMRRIKTYLRSSMLQERLNSTLILHVHKDLTDSLDLNAIANDFVSKNGIRKTKFPHFD